MKKQKTLKRAASAVVAAVLMMSAASAQVVYEQDFENVTQYDLFGNVFKYTGVKDTNMSENDKDNIKKNLFRGTTTTKEVEGEDGAITTINVTEAKDYGTGELLVNADTLSGRDSVSFFSIEDEKGVITKVGGEYNGEYYGFKKNLSEEIKTMNTPTEIPEEGNTTAAAEETTAIDSVIKSGVWNFDFKLQTMTGWRRNLIFTNGTTEKLALSLAQYPQHTKIADTVSNAEKSETIGQNKIDNNAGNFGFMLYAGNGQEYQMRFQLNFEKNSLQIYRWFNNGWKQITRIPQYGEDGKITDYDDECGISLKDFGVDLKDGIDGFAYTEGYHNDPCRMIIDDIMVSNNSDNTVLWNCKFDDETKDSWWDYGFENYTRKETAWVEDGKLCYSMENNRDVLFDKKIGETANSGVWAVSVKYFGETKDGKAQPPASYNGQDPRSFINFLNDTYNSYGSDKNSRSVALGISTNGYTYSHMWKVTGLNGEAKDDILNGNSKRPADGASFVCDPITGAEYKVVIDFNTKKMYMYAKVTSYNQGKWTLINPTGYDLGDNFSFNKIRLYDCNNGQKGYGAWDYIKIEKFNSADEVVLTATGDEGGYIGSGDKLNIVVESYRAPTEESKTTYIDQSSINVAAAVYDGNKLVDLKFMPNVQYSAFEAFKGDILLDKIGNGNKIKVFAVDPTNLRPLSDIKTFEGISFD